MGTPLVDSVELRVTSPAAKLVGLENGIARLKVMEAHLRNVQNLVSGMSFGTGLAKSRKEIEGILKGGTTKNYGVRSVAEMLGVPADMMPKFDSLIRQWKSKNVELAKARMQTVGMAGGGRELAFTSAPAAAKTMQPILAKLDKNRREAEAMMRAMFEPESKPTTPAPKAAEPPKAAKPQPPPSGAQVPLMITREQEQALADLGYKSKARKGLTPQEAQTILSEQRKFGAPPAPRPAPVQPDLPVQPPKAATVEGAVNLIVPVDRIHAELGPGNVKLIVPADRVNKGNASPGEGGGGTGGTEGGAGKKGAGGKYSPGGASGTQLEEKTTTTEKSRTVQRKDLVKAGETVDSFYKVVNGIVESDPFKSVETTSPLKKAKAKLEEQMAGVKASLQEELAVLSAGKGKESSAREAIRAQRRATLKKQKSDAASAVKVAQQELAQAAANETALRTASKERLTKAGTKILSARGVVPAIAQRFAKRFTEESGLTSFGEEFRTKLNEAFHKSGLLDRGANKYSSRANLEANAQAAGWTRENIEAGVSRHDDRNREIRDMNQVRMGELDRQPINRAGPTAPSPAVDAAHANYLARLAELEKLKSTSIPESAHPVNN